MRGVTLELSTLGARHEYLRGVVTGLGVRSCHTNIFSDNVLYTYIYIYIYIYNVVYTVLSCKNKCTVYQTSVGWYRSGWYGNQTSGGSALTRCFDKLLGTSGVCFSCDGTLPYDGPHVCS